MKIRGKKRKREDDVSVQPEAGLSEGSLHNLVQTIDNDWEVSDCKSSLPTEAEDKGTFTAKMLSTSVRQTDTHAPKRRKTETEIEVQEVGITGLLAALPDELIAILFLNLNILGWARLSCTSMRFYKISNAPTLSAFFLENGSFLCRSRMMEVARHAGALVKKLDLNSFPFQRQIILPTPEQQPVEPCHMFPGLHPKGISGLSITMEHQPSELHPLPPAFTNIHPQGFLGLPQPQWDWSQSICIEPPQFSNIQQPGIHDFPVIMEHQPSELHPLPPAFTNIHPQGFLGLPQPQWDWSQSICTEPPQFSNILQPGMYPTMEQINLDLQQKLEQILMKEDKPLIELFRVCSDIQELDLSWKSTTVTPELLENLPVNLEVLDLTGCKVLKGINLIKLPRNLKCLILDKSSFILDEEQAKNLPPGLQHLSCDIETDSALASLPVSLKSLIMPTMEGRQAKLLPRGLEHLSIIEESIDMTVEDVADLPRGLQSLFLDVSRINTQFSWANLPSGLQSLGLPYSNLDDMYLANFPNLDGIKHLDLSFSTITAACLASLPKGLKSLNLMGVQGIERLENLPTGLQALWLGGNGGGLDTVAYQIKDEDLNRLPENLQFLYLSMHEVPNDLSDSSLKYLPKRLQSLVLGIDISDEGLKNLPEHLVNLRLEFFPGTDTGLLNLPKGLRSLDIVGSLEITDAGIENFLKFLAKNQKSLQEPLCHVTKGRRLPHPFEEAVRASWNKG